MQIPELYEKLKNERDMIMKREVNFSVFPNHTFHSITDLKKHIQELTPDEQKLMVVEIEEY